jgi:hypothetical protein
VAFEKTGFFGGSPETINTFRLVLKEQIGGLTCAVHSPSDLVCPKKTPSTFEANSQILITTGPHERWSFEMHSSVLYQRNRFQIPGKRLFGA